MKMHLSWLLLLLTGGCQSRGFERDQRQLIAKDLVLQKVPERNGIRMLHFREDTLNTPVDTLFQKPIQYTLFFSYKDSMDQLKNGKGVVVFDPAGRAVLRSEVVTLP